MELVYNLSGFAIIIVIVVGLIGIVKPNALKRALKQHASRGKIFAGSLGALLILGGLIGATEPQHIKDARAAKEQAAVAAQQLKEVEAARQKTRVAEVKVETKTETKAEPIAFAEDQREDNTLAKGQTKVTQEGVTGKKTITYKVTYKNGKEKTREIAKEEITVQPINKIIAIGNYTAPKPKTATKPAPSPTPTSNSLSCNPNYSGCVPIASDVDCAGGTGDGPAYLSGSARVIGTDVYGLDRDKNGIACD